MEPTRRALLLVVVATLTVTAGCSGGVLDSEGPIEATASEVSISGSALDEAGFEEAETREVEINRTVEVQDEERQVRITNYAAGYQLADSGDAEAPAVVAVVSTPEVRALGFDVNPVASMEIQDAVSFAADAGAQFGGNLDDIEQVDTWETTVLEEETTVTKFAATIERDGETVDVYAHATKLNDGEDTVLVVGAYPQVLEEEGFLDGEDLEPMFEGVEHDTES